MRLNLMMLLLFGILNTAYAGQQCENKIDSLVSEKVPSAFFGGMVAEAKTGKVLYSRHANKLFSPASLTKLITAYTALKVLGPDYRFKTKLLRYGHHYYLKMVGDPSFTKHDLANLLAYFKAHPDNKGRLYLDISHFKKPDIPDDVSYEDLGWYYSAPISSVILDENAVQIHITTPKGYKSPKIKLRDPSNHGLVHIDNHISVATSREIPKRCSIDVSQQGSNHSVLSGCVRKRTYVYKQKLSVADPVKYALAFIKQEIRRQKLRISKRVSLDKVPKRAKVVAIHQSRPLTHILRHMMQLSDNVYANSLLKTMGEHLYKVGSFSAGIKAVRETLRQSGYDPNAIELSDGAGNRYNLISPSYLSKLLLGLAKNRTFYATFTSLLPVSGKTGSLEDRMTSSDLKGKVYAKTGSMRDISGLAGYFKPKDLVFVLMFNHFKLSRSQIKSLEDKVITAVAACHDW